MDYRNNNTNPNNLPNQPENRDINFGNVIPQQPSVDNRSLGGSVIRATTETPVKNPAETAIEASVGVPVEVGGSMVPETPHFEAPERPQPPLGEIVNMDPTPAPTKEDNPSTKTINFEVIRNNGDRLSDAAIAEIDNCTDEFKQTGNAGKFYETAREAMEKNLENSYNRKLTS